MRKLFMLALIIFLTINLNAQHDTNRVVTIKELNKKIEIFKEEKDNTQFLLIKNLNDHLIKKIEIAKGADPFYFGPQYINGRNFIIIGGRYKFFILNLTNNKFIGPLSFSSMRGQCREDAQSGALGLFQIFDNGQYLIFHAIDFGVYCYSLLDLYKPQNIEFFKSDSIIWKGNFIFIDKRKENIFNIVSAQIDGNYPKKIKSTMIFKGYRFQLDERGNIKHEIIHEKFLKLIQITPDRNHKEVFLNMDTGEIAKNIS